MTIDNEEAILNAALEKFARLEHGDECNLCQNGTVEIIDDDYGVVEVRCTGECGAVVPAEPKE